MLLAFERVKNLTSCDGLEWCVEKGSEVWGVQAVSGSFDSGGKSVAFAQDDGALEGREKSGCFAMDLVD